MAIQPVVPVDDLLDGWLKSDGLTYVIFIEKEGVETFRANTDWHRADAMLFAVENKLAIDHSYNLYLHHGRDVPSHGEPANGVQHLGQILKERTDVRSAILWHVCGEPHSHLEYSAGMTFEEAEQHLERLARDEMGLC